MYPILLLYLFADSVILEAVVVMRPEGRHVGVCVCCMLRLNVLYDMQFAPGTRRVFFFAVAGSRNPFYLCETLLFLLLNVPVRIIQYVYTKYITG